MKETHFKALVDITPPSYVPLNILNFSRSMEDQNSAPYIHSYSFVFSYQMFFTFAFFWYSGDNEEEERTSTALTWAVLSVGKTKHVVLHILWLTCCQDQEFHGFRCIPKKAPFHTVWILPCKKIHTVWSFITVLKAGAPFGNWDLRLSSDLNFEKPWAWWRTIYCT